MEKTIVFLHGFGEDHRIFSREAAVLGNTCRVFAPDLPGSGTLNEHNWLPGTETIEWLAEWVVERLKQEGIEECILMGHSMGGYIALAIAEKYPGLIRAFGLIHSTAFADTAVKKETRAKAIAFMQEKGAFSFLKTAIPGLFAAGFAAGNPEVVNQLIEKSKDFRVNALAAYYRAMIARPDRSHVLKSLQVPVLIVAGEEDAAVPLDDLLTQSAMPSVCHFHILKQTGHMGMLEAPENLHDILLNFIEVI